MKTSVIISVYQDVAALDLILRALSIQTDTDFETIVSEDGEDPGMAAYLSGPLPLNNVRNLTQADEGFRKNRALNRAIVSSSAEWIIFIDGDCVPHPRFVEAHTLERHRSKFNCGRRVELGPQISQSIRSGTLPTEVLATTSHYLTNLPKLIADNTKNIEYGFVWPFLPRWIVNREISIVGCNFSCAKKALLEINGFDESYQSAGIGEDSDIEWRLRANQLSARNIKFSAIQYHLHHQRSYTVSYENHKLLDDRRAKGDFYCKNGIVQTL